MAASGAFAALTLLFESPPVSAVILITQRLWGPRIFRGRQSSAAGGSRPSMTAITFSAEASTTNLGLPSWL
jgi:hypothetical protein